ncbi:toxin glutamine deamidase domain-containing protein [Nocardia sp. NPDC050193]
MGIEIPESLQWVAKYVVGAGDWPEGDETAMRRVESAWTKLATDLRDVDADANYAIDQVLASIEGDTAQAIADRWTRLGHGQGAFDGLIAHIETLADEIGDGAADIEQTKLVILASLAIFAVEMAVALAAASTGIGAPAAAAEAATAQVATRIAIRTAIKQLVQRILSKAALKAAARAAVRGAWEAALEETALDLGTKALQVATGRRDEITTEDLTEAGKNALTAAAGGAVTGAMGPDGLTSRNVTGGPEGGNPLANAAKDAAKETVAGAAGEVAGEATDAALNNREFSWGNALAPENLSSAAAGGLQRGTETLGESNSGDGPTTTGENSESGGDESTPNETSNAGDQQNGEAPGSRADAGDRGGATTPQNSNQAARPAGTESPPTPDTSTQTSSSNQQSPGQPAETGSQPAGQQTPPQPGPESTTGSRPEASPTASESPQSTESGPAAPDTAQPAHTDVGTPETQRPPTDTPQTQQPSADTPNTQQVQPTDSGRPESPNPFPDNEAQTEAGDSPPDSQRAPEATQTPGADDEPTASDPAPVADAEPPAQTSGLNLGPETAAAPDAGASSPAAPETTTTASAATATPTVQPTPVTSAVTPSSAPADAARATTTPDTSATPPGATPAGSPRNRAQSSASRDRAADPGPDNGSRHDSPADPSGPTSESAPNTPGDSYNLFDPANHARFLADFARPPIPDRPLPATDRLALTGTRPGRDDDPSNGADPSHRDAPTEVHSAEIDAGTPPRTTDDNPSGPATETAGTDRSSPPSSNRPPDPIWNSPESHPTSTEPGGRPQPTPPADPAGSGPRPSSPSQTRPTDPSAPGPHRNVPPRTPDMSDPGRSWWRPEQRRPDRSDSDIHAARAAREFHRNQPPLGNLVTPVQSSRNPHGRPAYRTTRHRLPNGEILHVLTVRVHPTLGPDVTPADINRLIATTERSIDRDLNTAPQLASGDRVLVDVVFTPNPYDADVHISTSQGRPPGTNTWSVESTPEMITNSIRQQLGLDPVRQGSDPTLTPDDLRVLSNDIARANTAPRFSNPSDARVEGRGRLRPVENPAYQRMVEDSLRDGNRFIVGADPRYHPYGQLVNDGGPGVAGRSNNCLDCSLSALSSFYGEPQVSAPRWRDRQGLFRLDRVSGEVGGVERAAAWLGGPLRSYDPNMPVPQQFHALHNHIAALGPGSSALVVNSWAQGGSHATVIVYPYGASGPVWWDPQSGQTSAFPPPAMVANSNALLSTPVPPRQGVNNAPGAPVPHQQPSGPVPEGAVRPGGTVQPSGDGVRVGVPSDPDPAGDSGRHGPGPGELRGEQTDRGDHRTSQPAPGTDRPGVRPGDPVGPTGSGRPGISPDLERADPGDPGNPDRYRIPSTSTVADQPAGGTPDRSPAADQQANVPHGDQRAGDPPGVQRSGGLGGGPEPGDRDLAAGRDIPVLDRELNSSPTETDRVFAAANSPTNRQASAAATAALESITDAQNDHEGARQTGDEVPVGQDASIREPAEALPEAARQVAVDDPRIRDLLDMQRAVRRAASIGWRTMGGALQFEIGDITGAFAGFSGERDVTANVPRGVEVPPVAPPAEGNAIVPSVAPEGGLRSNDAENNMLEHLHSLIQQSIGSGSVRAEDIRGNVRLFSEQQPCPSCSRTIGRFREIYRGITIEVFYVTPYPPVRRDRPTL